jgi:site-specific recombinase XerD
MISIKELLGHASIKSSGHYIKLLNQRVKHVYLQMMR